MLPSDRSRDQAAGPLPPAKPKMPNEKPQIEEHRIISKRSESFKNHKRPLSENTFDIQPDIQSNSSQSGILMCSWKKSQITLDSQVFWEMTSIASFKHFTHKATTQIHKTSLWILISQTQTWTAKKQKYLCSFPRSPGYQLFDTKFLHPLHLLVETSCETWKQQQSMILWNGSKRFCFSLSTKIHHGPKQLATITAGKPFKIARATARTGRISPKPTIFVKTSNILWI